MSLNFGGCSRMCGLVTSVEYIDAEVRVMEVEMLDLECRHGLLSTFLHLLFLFLHLSKMSPRSPMELTRPERFIVSLLLASLRYSFCSETSELS